MRIPKYWSRQRVSQDVDGEPLELSCSGWSYSDMGGAVAKAFERAERMFKAIREGRPAKEYSLYLDRPVKEEIISEFSADGLDVIVTRTNYGSLVLNTASVMFIDIDQPAPRMGSLWDALKSLFTGRRKAVAVDWGPWEAGVLENVDRVCQGRQLSLRLYRTYKGMRGLVTNRLFEPDSPEARAILKDFQSDELYVRLCKTQDCFRARLTPKPIRCGLKVPAHRFPYENKRELDEQREWESGYSAAIESFATCKLVGEFGGRQCLESIGKIVKLHDGMTKVDSGLALA